MQIQRFKNSLAENELYWLGGFIDGEGCFYLVPERVRKAHGKEYTSHDIQFVLGQSGDAGKELLVYLASSFDLGKVSQTNGSNLSKKTPYQWRFGGKDAVDFAEFMLPYLNLKKKKAQEIVDFWKTKYAN